MCCNFDSLASITSFSGRMTFRACVRRRRSYLATHHPCLGIPIHHWMEDTFKAAPIQDQSGEVLLDLLAKSSC